MMLIRINTLHSFETAIKADGKMDNKVKSIEYKNCLPVSSTGRSNAAVAALHSPLHKQSLAA